MASEPVNPTVRFAGSAFRKYATELHRFLLRRLRSPQDAEDLAQEVFMRLLRIENTELVRKPQSYLFGIASHVVREFRMRAEQEHERVTYDSQALDDATENPSHVSPDDLAERLNTQRQLERALAKLPRTHRAILLIVKRDGLSHEEAAKAAHMSVHTVEKYVIEARARLKTMEWDR
jgi:RNA polymerase sigma-19 factor, ECF subfamily